MAVSSACSRSASGRLGRLPCNRCPVSRHVTGRRTGIIVWVEESEMTELPSYRTILFATDGSDYAALAEPHALALALRTGARIEGVYVVDTHVALQFGILAREALDELKQYGQQALDGLTQRARQL